MALSNILKEPRREITETAVGLLVVVPLFLIDYFFARRINDPDGMVDAMFMTAACFTLCLFLLFVGTIATVFAVKIVHAIGEFFCNVLELRGVHLRPRTRR